MHGYRGKVRRVLVLVLAANLSVVLVKAFAGWRSGSLAVLSDAVHSLVDASNNVVALLILHFATAPPDADHPYGHRRFETLGAFVFAGLLFLTAFELGRLAVLRLAGGATLPTFDPVVVVLVAGTAGANLVVAALEMRAGRRLGSEMLSADAAHTMSDVGVATAVVLGYVLSSQGLAWLDPVVSLGVAVVIGIVGFRIFQASVPVLTDRAVYDPALVERLVREVPGVSNVHDVRSRGRPGEGYVQMHLVVDTRDVEEAHAVTVAVERKLEDALGAKEVFVHVEPWDDSERSSNL